MSIYIKCENPFQHLALLHIEENFLEDGVKELALIKNGIRLTDVAGAVADFVYNGDTGNIDFHEVDSKQLQKEARRKKNIELIQRDLLRSLKNK